MMGRGENTRKFVTQGYSHTQVLVLANLEEGAFGLSLLVGLGEKSSCAAVAGVRLISTP